jgi:hypothetical protein
MKAQIARKMIVPIVFPMRSSGGSGLLITSLCMKTSTPAILGIAANVAKLPELVRKT